LAGLEELILLIILSVVRHVIPAILFGALMALCDQNALEFGDYLHPCKGR